MSDRKHRRLTISQALLGPIRPCTVEVRPFTVLIGKQGTGKSLLSQILYFFENLSYLMPYYGATLAASGSAADRPHIVQAALNNLRSSGQPLSTFMDNATTLEWEPG